MSIVTCQCGSTWCRVFETVVTSRVNPAWSALPSPSRSRFTPSRLLASTAPTSALVKVVAAAGFEVKVSSELWSKSFTVRTTRIPAWWAWVIKVESAWLS